MIRRSLCIEAPPTHQPTEGVNHSLRFVASNNKSKIYSERFIGAQPCWDLVGSHDDDGDESICGRTGFLILSSYYLILSWSYILYLLRGSHHDSSDDGDESIAVGQQPVGGLGAARLLPLGRTDAGRERGGGGGVAPRLLPLHRLLDLLLDDVFMSLHGGGAQRSSGGPHGALRSHTELRGGHKEPRGATRSSEELRGGTRSPEEPHGARRSYTEPGGATRSPEELRGGTRSPEEPQPESTGPVFVCKQTRISW